MKGKIFSALLVLVVLSLSLVMVGPMATPALAATPHMVMNTGSYTGNGVDDRSITGVGFQPDVVFIKGNLAQTGTFRTSTMVGDASKSTGTGTALFTNRIQSFGADGFTIGTDADVNKSSGETYYWVAFKAFAGEMKVGSYAGDGTASHDITSVGFQPDYVIVMAATAQAPVQATSSLSGTSWDFFGGDFTNAITAMLADGFRVGNNARTNTNTTTYYYIAWKAVSGRMKVGSYTGNGADNRSITGVSFQPDWLIIQRATTSDAQHKPFSTGAGTDSSQVFTANANASDRIQKLENDGFQVGTRAEVNSSSGNTTYYYMAFNKSYTITVTPTSGLVTTEALGTATFTIVLDSPPTADVTIGLTSSDTTEGTVSPASVTFTTANWSTPRTVTVTGVDDYVDDGDIPYSIVTAAATSTDPNYSGLIVDDVSVTNTDNDTAGITVSLCANTTESGGAATFTIRLDSEPTASVTIGLTSSNPAEGAVSPASVNFTSGNWSAPQTVTVTGVDDFIIDGDILYSIVTAPATSTDPKYSSMDAADVNLTNIDNDVAGVTVTPTAGLVTSEAGGMDTFTIQLDTIPSDNVSIGLTSSNPAEGTVSTDNVTFTALDWDIAQTITVTGVDDALADGPVLYTIITADAVSTDHDYSGLPVDDVSVTNTDNDTAGITVAPTAGLVTSEGGGTDTFTIVLNTIPSDNVSIDLSSNNTAEGTVSPASVTFTTANWNIAQLVTVTGVDDYVDDGDIPYTIVTDNATSTDVNYNGLNPSDVSVTNTDDDTAGVTVIPTSGLVTSESGGMDTFTIQLDTIPSDNVTIGLSSSNTAEGTVSPASVTFTTANWNIAQLVTVTGVDDYVDDGDIPYTIITTDATSTDPKYSGLAVSDVSVTNTDDDTAGVTVIPTAGLVTTESSGTDNFTIQLDSEPTADVTIGLTSSDLTEGTVSTDNVTFTSVNWNTPQTVTVTGVDDLVADGPIPYTIITDAATSTDPKYSGLAVDDVSVTNNDDDTAGVTVIPTAGLVTSEGGGTDNFTIQLNTIPSDNVTIGLSSSNTAEGTLSPASVTFTSGNWNTPQTVTVTGVDDFVVDGNIPYTIVTDNATSTDPNYNGLNPSDVSVTNTDDDVAGGGGGGGGGGSAANSTTNLLNVDILGRVRGVEVTDDGTIVTPSIVVSLDKSLTLELNKGTRIIAAKSKVPMELALAIANEPPPIPDGMVLVSQVYDCVAYSDGRVSLPVSFDPPATLLINYSPEKVPENASAIFIAYYDAKLGWVPLDAPSGFVTEAGTAAAEVSHFTPFAVLVELAPPPPAYFEVSNLDISPSQVGIGEKVIISAQIANTGGVSGEYTLTVNVEGLLEKSQALELAPEQSQEVSFTVTPDTPGSYQVEIGGLQGNFEVVAAPPPAEAGGFKWSTPWFIAVIAAMVLAVLVLPLIRKRPQPVPVAGKPQPPKPVSAPSQTGKAMAAIAGLASTLVRKRPRPTATLKAPSEPTPTVAEKPSGPVPPPSPVGNMKVIPNRVKPGETVYVFAEATNNAPTASSSSLVLKVRGVVEAVKEITLGPRQSQKVAFIVLRDKPGVYGVELEGLKGSFIVEEPSEPTPTAAEEAQKPAPVPSPVRDLEIIPHRVKPRKIVNIFAEVTNNAPTTSNFSLVLKVKDVVESVKEITLGPQQSQKVAFTVLRDKPGVYEVELEGLKDSFTVEI